MLDVFTPIYYHCIYFGDEGILRERASLPIIGRMEKAANAGR